MNNEVVSNIKIYGFEDSVKASGYPMTVDHAKSNVSFDRAGRLANSEIGSGHDNFLNGIIVQFDLTLSVHAWKEAERYHFLDFVSSQSTMHKLSEMNLDEVCMPYVDEQVLHRVKDLQKIYQHSQDEDDWRRLIYSYPSGLCLTARMTTNYRQLKTIYKQRLTHRLPEWRDFCHWIETLPYAEWITG